MSMNFFDLLVDMDIMIMEYYRLLLAVNSWGSVLRKRSCYRFIPLDSSFKPESPIHELMTRVLQ